MKLEKTASHLIAFSVSTPPTQQQKKTPTHRADLKPISVANTALDHHPCRREAQFSSFSAHCPFFPW